MLLQIESLSREFADSLYHAVQIVGDHTDEFSGCSLLVTLVSLVASLMTIFGIWTFFKEWKKTKVEEGCQKRIIMDMIRHMFTNNSISEVIRLKYPPEGKSVLKEGVLDRYCFLESDIELKNMDFSEESYEYLHSLKLRLKNYNSVAIIAERHFTDPNCPKSVRLEDLNDIWERSIRLTEGFLEYAKAVGLNLSKKDISDYIRTYHNKEDRIPAWKKENIINYKLILPPRKGTGRSYYDKEPYLLGDILDTCIRYRASIIYFRVNPDSKKTRKS